MILSTKVKKSINTGLRIVVAFLALWFIYDQVTQPGSFEAFIDTTKLRWLDNDFIYIIIVVIALMPVNWGIEALKWRMLISFSEKITLWESLMSVLTGITMSLFTPNRIGEFLGRSLSLKHTHLLKGSILTIVGSISQLLTTLIAGIIALVFFIPQYYDITHSYGSLIYAFIMVTSVTIGIILLMMFLRFSALSRLTTSIIRPGWQKIRAYLRVVRRLKRRFLLKILMLSIARYLVFSFQFYLLLHAFELEIPIADALILIAMTYFVMTAIPTIALADLGIRGSVSIYFISLYFSENAGVEVAILAATTMVWTINLALPALVGLLFINRIKVIKKI